MVSFVRSDHIGRPVFATNSSGVKVWTAAYLPFGGVRVSTGTPPTARFPGQWFQSETGLQQNWMRDYDPTAGRYIQADPLGLIDGASVYGYAGGNPGRYVDPRGELIGFGPWGALVGALGSGIIQFATNYLIGGMSWQDSVKCIDLVAVTNAAAIGSVGYSPGMLWRSGLRTGAVGVGLVGVHANRAFPNYRIADLLGESCNCNLPPWADKLRDFMP